MGCLERRLGMNAEEFVKEYKGKFFEYCPSIISETGEVIACADGHLKALLELFSKECPKQEIPKDVSPMHYCIVKLSAVVVDYENQVYSQTLTKEQKEALTILADHGMIDMHLADIHGKYILP